MSVESLLDQFPLLAAAPEGVKRLRELILELAVCGKLVPQDPNDEPVSELLKRIQAEKTRLVAEGKIKKDKPLPEIGEDEKSFELPAGWAFARLGEVVEIVRGITFPSNEKSKTPEAGRVACLRTANVQDQLEWDDLLFIKEEFITRDDQYLQPLDIVMSMANSRELVGKVALTDSIPHTKATFGGFLGVLRSILVDPRFVMAKLRTPTSRGELIDSASQTTNIANIGVGKLRPLVVALPPLAEQYRIVAKVDELMALCDRLEEQQADTASAHTTLVKTLLDTLTQVQFAADFADNWQRLAQHFDTLFTTEASIDALKQTLLQLAVMGKLVAQNPNDEPTSELLKRIQAEKAKLVAEGKIKKDKPLPGIGEDEKPYELPDGWTWVFLGSLVSNMDAGWSPACHDHKAPTNETWGVLKTTAVQVMAYLEHENKELPSDLQPRPEYEVHAGDILITRAGPKNRVAISCLVNDTRPKLMISDKIIRFHLLGDIPSDLFVSLCLNAGATAQYLEAAKSGMAESQMNISQEKLKRAPIPLAPLAEQHRIVAKVDELMALCDQLAARLKAARELAVHYATAATEAALEAA